MDNLIIIIIKTPKTQSEGVQIKTSIDKTIGEAKSLYYQKVGHNINNQWLFNAEILQDTNKIQDYEIDNLDVIEAHTSSNGGIILNKKSTNYV